jgi:hypothetical protein
MTMKIVSASGWELMSVPNRIDVKRPNMNTVERAYDQPIQELIFGMLVIFFWMESPELFFVW